MSAVRRWLIAIIQSQSPKIWGIFGLLVAICIYTAWSNDAFLLPLNIENLVRRTALLSILSIGAAFVIITSGIDLSIGSVVCLVGVLLPFLLKSAAWPVPEAIKEFFGVSWPPTQGNWPVAAALPFVIGLAVAIGVAHGLLITRMRLQPFVVTLCGLLLYRGLARGITNDRTQGFGNDFEGLKEIGSGRLAIFSSEPNAFHLPTATLIMLVIAVVAAIFLNKTIYGRYLLALGNNAEAARYSGVNVNRMTLLAYIICATLAGIGGSLYLMDSNSAQPSNFGNGYELYAIAAAVLGGCSLRGGEGSIIGVLIGSAVIIVLRNTINLVHPQFENIELAIIGGVILIGVIADELARRFVAARREAARHADK
jgi:ribose transport system permease protein